MQILEKKYVKTCKLIVKILGFGGVTTCVRDLKTYQQNIKNETNIDPKIYEKSMQVS